MSNGSKRVIRAKLAREHKKINIVKSMTLEECFEKYIFAKKSEGVTDEPFTTKRLTLTSFLITYQVNTIWFIPSI